MKNAQEAKSAGMHTISMKDRGQEVQGGGIKRRYSATSLKQDTVARQRKSVNLGTSMCPELEGGEVRVHTRVRIVRKWGAEVREVETISHNITPLSRAWKMCQRVKRARAGSTGMILTEVEKDLIDSRMTEVVKMELEGWKVRTGGADRDRMMTGE